VVISWFGWLLLGLYEFVYCDFVLLVVGFGFVGYVVGVGYVECLF